MEPEPTFLEKMSDQLTAYMGSWPYIFTFLLLTLAWMILNHSISADPYPHQFLNLIIGILSALAAPLIMMSQNRQELRDNAREEKDLATDLENEATLIRLEEKITTMLLLVSDLKDASPVRPVAVKRTTVKGSMIVNGLNQTEK